MPIVGNVGLYAVSLDEDSVLTMDQSCHPLSIHWLTVMMDFRHNETLGADVMKYCKGYASIKYDAGLLIN